MPRRFPAPIALAVMLWSLSPSAAGGFVLTAQPPAERMTMTLSLGTSTLSTVEGVTTTFNLVAQSALDTWNGVGVGTGQDHAFFLPSLTASVTSSCTRDFVNVVAFSATACGQDWGDAVGLTSRFSIGGLMVESDVVFNENRTWNAYSGPLRFSGGQLIQDFTRVALHEFGHVIGLGHPPAGSQAIMAPTESNIDRLQPDDIAGVHAIPFSGAAQPPSARVTVNGTAFRPGLTLTVDLDIENPAGNPTVDVYVGALLPDGVTALFFTPTGFTGGVSLGAPASFTALDTLATGAAIRTGATVGQPPFFSITFGNVGLAPGAYRLFAAVVRQGSLRDNRLDPGDILSLDVETLSFSL